MILDIVSAIVYFPAMSKLDTKPSERYFVAHQWTMVLGLIFVLALCIYNLVEVFNPTTGGPKPGVFLISAAFIVVLLAVQFVILRSRMWRPGDAAAQTILRDEWVLTNHTRAARTAFWVMLCAQWPMMFI